MKKKIFKFIKKQWLLVWTLIVAVVLLSVVVSAEYPGTNNYMKRVVVYDETSDVMFSSNLLTTYDDDKIPYQPYYTKVLPAQSVAQSYDVDVYLWNYDIDGTSDYYKQNISYTLEISVVDEQGNVVTGLDANKWIQVIKNDSASALCTFNSTGSSAADYTFTKTGEVIETGGRKENKYTISFSKSWDLSADTNKRVQIKATPTPASSYPDIKPLAAAIGLREEKSGESSGWEYYINEKTLSNTAVPSDFDAYNLVLTGSGSKKITIEWDKSKVALNKDFYEANGAFPFIPGEVVYTQDGGSAAGWDKLVIYADSDDPAKIYRNRYDVQVYKVNGELGTTWDFIGDTMAAGTYITVTISAD